MGERASCSLYGPALLPQHPTEMASVEGVVASDVRAHGATEMDLDDGEVGITGASLAEEGAPTHGSSHAGADANGVAATSVAPARAASVAGAASAWTYEPVYTLQGHKRSVSALAISPDGRELASSGADGLVKIWALATGSLLATLDYTVAAGELSSPFSSYGVPDDRRNERPRRPRGISDVAWTRDGHYLVCGGDDKVVRVWDAKRRKLVRQLVGHTSFVFCVTFSPDGTLVISGGFDETVRLWDLRRGTCHRTIAAHSEAVTGVDCNRDGSILASCSYDGLIRLWDASTGQCLKTLVHGEAQPIGHVSFSPNGFQLLATSLDGTVRLWDMANTRVLKTYTGHQNAKFALKAAFTAWQSGPVPAGESNSNARRVDRSSTNAVDAAQPPCMVAVGSEDHRVYLWDLQTKTVTQMLLGHRDAVICIATHERIPIIASASLDRDPCIKVWRAVRSHAR